jgi:hypothetical protein
VLSLFKILSEASDVYFVYFFGSLVRFHYQRKHSVLKALISATNCTIFCATQVKKKSILDCIFDIDLSEVNLLLSNIFSSFFLLYFSLVKITSVRKYLNYPQSRP